MGPVTLVLISSMMAVSESAGGSAKEKELMMPALMKTVLMFGKDLVSSETLDGRVAKSVTSSLGGVSQLGMYEGELNGLQRCTYLARLET